MSVTVGLVVAVVFVLACTVPAMVVLLFTGARATGRTRRGYRMLAGALAAGAGGLGFAAIPTGWAGPGLDPGRLVPFAAGAAICAFGLVAGLLHLPGAADVPGAPVRRMLDGALLAACALHVSWTLVIEPVHGSHLGAGWSAPTRDCLLLAVPTLGAFATCGVAAVVVGQARRPRAGLARAGGLASLATMLAVGLMAMLRYGTGAGVAWLGAGYGLCLLATASAARYRTGGARPPVRPTGTGTLLALVPASMAIGAAIVRVAIARETDNVSIAIAAVVGGLLAARQTVAGRDAYRYAAKLAEREARMREMAHTDALTGLANRRRLLHALHQEGAGTAGYVLLAIDLDGFKSVNDLRGHDVGDEVLVEVGRRLRNDLRPGDLAVRLGGDEFAVLMATGLEEAQRVARRLLRLLGQPYHLAGATLFLSASIGLAAGSAGCGATALLHNADLSLRFAKMRGKNRVEHYDAAYGSGMHRRTTLEQDLRAAIDHDELSLVYQPVVELPGGRPVGVEALLRWRHPRLGPVPPAEFIPLAEDSGMIGMLDRWVMHEACRQLSRWRGDGLDIWMAVNISARELHFADYVEQVREVTRAHRVPPDALVLEVTEHAIALDLAEMVERLRALRRSGVRVALDDFGAGYSSLGQLRDLPVDILKIDQSLVTEPSPASPSPDVTGSVPRGAPDVTGSVPRGAPDVTGSLVDVVVRLGQRLGLEVIAEGVARPAQRRLVEAAGCPLGQGDLFAAAAPAERIEALLAFPPVPRSLPTQDQPRPVQDLGQVDSRAGYASE